MSNKPAFDELRECDGCGKSTLSIEQNSCITAHFDSSDVKFKIRPCPMDYFYCPTCLNENECCDECSEMISTENQRSLLDIMKGRKF